MYKKKTSKKQRFCFEDMPIMKVKRETKIHHPERTLKKMNQLLEKLK